MLVLACTPTAAENNSLGWVGVCLCSCLLGTSPLTPAQPVPSGWVRRGLVHVTLLIQHVLVPGSCVRVVVHALRSTVQAKTSPSVPWLTLAVDATISRLCTAFVMHPAAVVLRNELSVVLLQSVLFTYCVGGQVVEGRTAPWQCFYTRLVQRGARCFHGWCAVADKLHALLGQMPAYVHDLEPSCNMCQFTTC
jgi:hypothetical protein